MHAHFKNHIFSYIFYVKGQELSLCIEGKHWYFNGHTSLDLQMQSVWNLELENEIFKGHRHGHKDE